MSGSAIWLAALTPVIWVSLMVNGWRDAVVHAAGALAASVLCLFIEDHALQAGVFFGFGSACADVSRKWRDAHVARLFEESPR